MSFFCLRLLITPLVFSNLYFYLYRVEVVYIGRSRLCESRRHTTFSDLSWEGRGGLGYDMVAHLSNVINA